MQAELTGKKFAAIMVGGFAIVIAVNFTMAGYATSGFSGTVVDNSYVASQKFNGWLDKAEAQAELGWKAELSRANGRLKVATDAVPDGAQVTAQIRRPLGQADARELTFNTTGNAQLLSAQELPAGRWIVRLTIVANGEKWAMEEQVG